jgi:hypothetical protein
VAGRRDRVAPRGRAARQAWSEPAMLAEAVCRDPDDDWCSPRHWPAKLTRLSGVMPIC